MSLSPISRSPSSNSNVIFKSAVDAFGDYLNQFCLAVKCSYDYPSNGPAVQRDGSLALAAVPTDALIMAVYLSVANGFKSLTIHDTTSKNSLTKNL